MANVVVTPEQFQNVFFDGARIVAIAAELAEQIGVPRDVTVHVDVDETTPFGAVSTMLDDRRLEIRAESAAFENAKYPRDLSEDACRLELALALFRTRDRLDPGFGEAPPDTALTFEQHTAWDASALGRYERLGHPVSHDRWRYHFRVRHGFGDAVDAVFDRLWSDDAPTWAKLDAACAETARLRLG